MKVSLRLLPGCFVLLAASCSTPSDNLATLNDALQNESRDQADIARDAGRKPAGVLQFLGVKPGMTVVDVIAASGYYTEVLALAVGDKGMVYSQNPKSVLEFRDGANDKALTKRLAGNRLGNVTRLDREFTDIGIEANSVDVAITALNFHDIYNGSGKDAAVDVSRTILGVLKPGGVFGVIDHVGTTDHDNAKLHRIQKELAVAALTEAGFTIEASSTLLENRVEDHSKMVFDATIRGQTDRFLIKAIKPAL
jgi:predicted methyltransferase